MRIIIWLPAVCICDKVTSADRKGKGVGKASCKWAGKMSPKQSKVAKKNKAKGSPAKAAASPKKGKAASSSDDDSSWVKFIHTS